MSNIVYSFIVTSIAGLSTLIGSFIIFLAKNKSNKLIIYSLNFATGVMITVSLTDLIPSSFNLLKNIFYIFPSIIICMIFIVTGIIFSMFIDKLIPNNNYQNNKLYRVGIFSMIAIIMHNIPEGIATFITTNNNIKLGISLSIAIALHNIPEGISIAMPIYYASNSRLKALFYTFISGISEIFGAVIAYLFLSPFINDFIMGSLYAIIAGIMFYISVYELIPSAKKMNNNKVNILFVIIGFIFMIINHYIFS